MSVFAARMAKLKEENDRKEAEFKAEQDAKRAQEKQAAREEEERRRKREATQMEARKKELKQAHDALYAPKQEKAKREEVNPFATGIEHNLLHQANGRASMVMKRKSRKLSPDKVKKEKKGDDDDEPEAKKPGKKRRSRGEEEDTGRKSRGARAFEGTGKGSASSIFSVRKLVDQRATMSRSASPQVKPSSGKVSDALGARPRNPIPGPSRQRLALNGHVERPGQIRRHSSGSSSVNAKIKASDSDRLGATRKKSSPQSSYPNKGAISAEIQNLFRRPGAAPRRFEDDSDDSDMEAGLDDQEEEDQRATRIARREDAEAEREEAERKAMKERLKRQREGMR